jgi:hypothetical protein
MTSNFLCALQHRKKGKKENRQLFVEKIFISKEKHGVIRINTVVFVLS